MMRAVVLAPVLLFGTLLCAVASGLAGETCEDANACEGDSGSLLQSRTGGVAPLGSQRMEHSLQQRLLPEPQQAQQHPPEQHPPEQHPPEQTPPPLPMNITPMVMGVPTTQVEEQWIRVNDRRYSRYKAQDALLGSWGPEMAGAYYPPHLSFQEPPESEWLQGNTAFVTTVTISSSQAGDFGFELATNAIPYVDIDVSADTNSSHDASFYLKEMKFASILRLTQTLNKPEYSELRASMKKMDRRRIVTSVWLLLKGDPEHSEICGGGSLTLKVKDYAKIVVSGSGCSMSTWEFSPNSVMAYEAATFKWQDDGTIDELTIDFYTR